MKLSNAVIAACILLGFHGNDAFSTSSQRREGSKTKLKSTIEAPPKATAKRRTTSKKQDRLRFTKSPQYHRKGFIDVRPKVEDTMEAQYKSDLVKDLKTNNYLVKKDGVKIYLAKDFGFCWGVERSIALAYEAVEYYPGKKLHITNELIHNPQVNDALTEMKVNLINKESSTGAKDFSPVGEGDVVILPAFGSSYEELDMLDKKVRHKIDDFFDQNDP